MNPLILTLFGEEYAPEPKKAPGKTRAKKNAAGDEPSAEPPETGAVAQKPARKKRAVAQKAKAPKKVVKKIPVVSSSAILNGWQPEKQYYTIGEVAALFKVNTSHIRFWTNEFAMKVRTTRKGDRLYTPDQILEIRTIYYLVKERGFTLAGAKARLKEEKKGVAESVSLKDSLYKLRNQLMAIREQLD
jgi:DNA-binding transcriptional MerR regulator